MDETVDRDEVCPERFNDLSGNTQHDLDSNCSCRPCGESLEHQLVGRRSSSTFSPNDSSPCPGLSDRDGQSGDFSHRWFDN